MTSELKPCPFGSNDMCGCQNGPHEPRAATPAPKVKAKALVWEGFRAGPYWIEVEAGGLAHLFCDYDRDEYGVEAMQGGFLTLVSIDDLKAAAQADYEARILAALEPAPAVDPMADPRVVALRDALAHYACDCGDMCEQLNGTCGDTARAALAALDTPQ